ncbi:tRNA uracil 4-sulfurtransferase ThiI [Natranaerofaba carboxydovora]|uniref:tRNA uracil 4-sulfurtransferase ThiI n=1 Tax=Natranaerofaba carboxydovora TaxID=2742683 RepID=UPI001F13CB44|nr:tRNA uracil 4-sulfurtransferase ThiI [Natranaerofaba carboxydovora]UMZ75073.1 putative tRNA sulfurtransferase [Natranaerofaba carboxydovora]
MFDYMLVRYGEISLKGKNRSEFEDRLVTNINNSLKGLDKRKINKTYGRIYVELKGTKEDADEVSDRLSKVFGIVSVSPAVLAPLDVEKIKDISLQVLKDSYKPGMSFKIDCKRSHKKFHKDSMEMNQILGTHILTNVDNLEVDVKNPDVTINVEIRENGAFIYSRAIDGPKGLPVGVTNKGILLLSGGIDSPVAGYLAMKRGIEVIGLHFTSPPFTSERSVEKVKDIAKEICKHGGRFKLYTNYFTQIQKAIQEKVNARMRVTIMRRYMYRIAQEVAKKEKAQAIITGENVGQVASQTLESINAISNVVDIPVIRPVACLDKQEITDLSKKIDTFSISTRPYEDCCTLFLPKKPETRPKINALQKEEERLNIEELINESIKEMDVEIFLPYEEKEELEFKL